LKKYKVELRFSKTGQVDGCWSIHGHGQGGQGGRPLFIVKRGHVKEYTDGRGAAYWVGETPTCAGQAHVAYGNFDFRTNSFRGNFVSETGGTGYFVTFELDEATSHQLVPTDDPDFEAPMAMVELVTSHQLFPTDDPDFEAPMAMVELVTSHQLAPTDDPDFEAPMAMVELVTSHQLVPTDDPDLEAPMAMAELVSVDHVHNDAASAIDTLEGADAQDFREAVTVASTETTEVKIGSRKKAITTDPLNGCYDIQFESQDDSSTVTHKTMELTFSRGFSGWFIHGTRRKHKNDDDDEEEDDGLFSIQRGFLAQSGKMYWEERRELKPSYSVLVVGMLDADMTGTFHGEWLSSQKGTTTGRVRARGRFRKFVRRDDNGQHENVIV
jgi:hypothetical protein